MNTSSHDARAAMRAAFASWPDVAPAVAAWMATLDWRARQVVILMHGENLTAAQVGERLGVSAETVGRDLARARAAWAEAQSA